LIRIQIELARLPERAGDRRALEEREDALLKRYERRWTAPLRAVLPEDVTTPIFHRGFVEEMLFWGTAGAEALVDPVDDLFTLLPLRALRLLPLGGHTTSPMPWETRMKTITDRLGPAELKALVRLPQLEGVQLLDFSGTTMSNPGGGPPIVVGNYIGDSGVLLLAECRHLQGLRVLLLRDNVISDRGALTLVESPALTGLTTLDLSHNR